jgi:hypothetical protein
MTDASPPVAPNGHLGRNCFRWDRDPIVRRLVISDARTMPEPIPCTTPSLDERPPERGPRVMIDAADAAPERDPVDDCGDASFPASDPPSWWSGR